MSAPAALGARIVLAACLVQSGSAGAQSAPTLLETYGRVTTLVSYMTVHVGELLLACAARNILTDEQVETRYQAYRKRNAVLLERAEDWSQDAETRLRAQGEERAAQRLAQDSSLTAMAAASSRAQDVINRAADVRAACAVRLEAIESGRYDLSGNAEIVELLKAKP